MDWNNQWGISTQCLNQKPMQPSCQLPCTILLISSKCGKVVPRSCDRASVEAKEWSESNCQPDLSILQEKKINQKSAYAKFYVVVDSEDTTEGE